MDDPSKYFYILLFTVCFCGCSLFERQPHHAVKTAHHSNSEHQNEESPFAGLTPRRTLSEVKENAEENEILADIESKLSKNSWVRNNELERYIAETLNGGKEDDRQRNAAALNRKSVFNRLNLSRKEAEKENRHSFEYSGGLISTWRWYNPEVETLLTTPPEEQQDISLFLTRNSYQDKQYLLLRSNAAILLARGYSDNTAQNNSVQLVNLLKQAIENNSLPAEMRCAAAETLAYLDDVPADDFPPLIETVKEKQVSKVNPKTGITENKLSSGTADLWIELLNSLAQKSAPWEHPCFTEALNAKNPKVRLECVRLWQLRRHIERNNIAVNRQERLPEAFLEYAKKEVEPLIRAEISEVLGQWKEPSILEILRSDLNGTAAQRNAAMDALAESNCRTAIPLIREKLRDPIGKNRAKAVEILRKYGLLDDVFKQSDDTAWEVRLEVARALADTCTPQTKEIAEKYLSDSVRIQDAVLESISAWQIRDSYPFLLKALQCNLKSIRQNAAEKLSLFLPEAKNYNTDALPKTIGEEYEAMVKLCNERFSGTAGTGKTVKMSSETSQTLTQRLLS
ncbi:MAG: HEAT repeat domain-containing protein, partial [Planctomycetaceae bacterium]|nr:HEAT repeat domain-containing protein [Planctomycetaceae bacterium]